MQSQTESPGLRLREGGGGISIVKAQGGQSMRSHLQREPWDLLPPSSRKQGAWHNAGRLFVNVTAKEDPWLVDCNFGPEVCEEDIYEP